MFKGFLKVFSSLILLFFVFLTGCKNEENITGPHDDHFKAFGVKLTESGIYYGSIFKGITTDTLKVPLGASTSHIDVEFYDENKNVIKPPTSSASKLTYTVSDTSIAEAWQHSGEEGGYEVHLRGKKAGYTEIEFFILHGDHVDYRSGKMLIKVESIAGTHGEPEGIKVFDEETGTLLITSYLLSENRVEGNISVTVSDTTDHLEVKFFDSNNILFQPPANDHEIEIETSNGDILSIIPPEPSEPYAFKIIGKITGTATVTIKLKHDGAVEAVFTPFTITVN